MEIDFERNELRISVVELASFERATRSIPRADRLLWRAQVGQEWHKVAEQQTRSRYPEAEFEKRFAQNGSIETGPSLSKGGSIR